MARDFTPANPPPGGSRKLCAACAHVAGFTPMTCGRFRDATGNAKLTQPLRQATGACGPEGAFWSQAAATGAAVIDFAARLPKAGRFA